MRFWWLGMVLVILGGCARNYVRVQQIRPRPILAVNEPAWVAMEMFPARYLQIGLFSFQIRDIQPTRLITPDFRVTLEILDGPEAGTLIKATERVGHHPSIVNPPFQFEHVQIAPGEKKMEPIRITFNPEYIGQFIWMRNRSFPGPYLSWRLRHPHKGHE